MTRLKWAVVVALFPTLLWSQGGHAAFLGLPRMLAAVVDQGYPPLTAFSPISDAPFCTMPHNMGSAVLGFPSALDRTYL